MPAAKLHPQETARLNSLIQLGLLDTEPEKMFDNIIELASEFINVPIALFSLVDENRQWFKSRTGLDATETERCDAFCAHAILDDTQPLVIDDATADPRFSDNPLVTGETGIRFYAGVAIKSPGEGLPLGTLCVIDQEPREISAREISILKMLASQLEHLLELRASSLANEKVTLALSRSEALVRGIIDNGQTFVGLMEPDGTLIDTNRPSLESVGLDAKHVLGKPLWETPWWAHSTEMQQRLQEAIGRAASGRPDRFEATHPTSSGKMIDVDFSLSPIIVNGEVTYLVPEGRDITLLRQRERENERYLVNLQETNHDLEQFAYIASHDLQSPLRGVSSIAGFIKEDDGDNLSESSKQYLQKLQTLILRMQHLLSDLLTYSRVGRSEEEAVVVDVGNVIEEVVQLLVIPEGFELQVPANLPVFTSHVAPLRLVFLNLINNAIKHHDKSGGLITLSADEQEDFFEFRITDDGPGIDKQYHGHIFEMFKSLQSRDDVEGSGMGLAIIQKIIRRYAGQLTIESTLGQGATFVFTWPKKNEQ